MMMYIYLYFYTQHLRIHVKSCSVQCAVLPNEKNASSPQCRTQMNIEYRTDTHLRVVPALSTLGLTVIGICNRYRNYSLRMATHMSRCSIMTSFLKKWSHESLRHPRNSECLRRTSVDRHCRVTRPSLPGYTFQMPKEYRTGI